MALISLRQLLDHAAENGYGLPAFNVNNMEQVQAIMQAADKTNSPVILQGSAGARSYAGEPFLRHLILAAIESYPHIPVCMHQDHGASPSICFRSIQSGFSSVMMDGSLLAPMARPPPAMNTTWTPPARWPNWPMPAACPWKASWAAWALETGKAGEEDGHGAEGVLDHSALLTDPERSRRLRIEDPGGCTGHRHRHQPRRLQVHQQAHGQGAAHRPRARKSTSAFPMCTW
jgi:fructose-bisphosphate aldolase class II